MNRFAALALGILSATPLLLAQRAAAPRKPKLVVAIVVDQFRYEYLLRFRDDYNSGLARLLQQGAVFTDAHYIHAHTVTAVGHSTFLSGALPSISGIIANDWFDRGTNSRVTSVSDGTTKLVGIPTGASGSSPRRMLVDTIGDELKIREGKNSKVIGISIKDRSAILPAGHMADGAFWFDAKANQWVTSTYYMQSLPEWATKVNEQHPAQRFATARWFPFGSKDESGTPFCSMAPLADVKTCASLEATPWGNEIIEEFAEQALAAEQLGKHPGTDLLAVSFSANDYVGHGVGPDDPAVRDMAIRTDRLLGQLFKKIEQSIGVGNMLVVLTADHGVAPVPEVNQARHMPGGRVSEPVVKNIGEALKKRFGPGEWIQGGTAYMIYLNLKLIEERKLDRAVVERAAAEVAAAIPHVARVYTRSEILSGAMLQDAISRAITASFYSPRSGDVIILPEPYYLFEQAPGTTHGTPYEYDTHVPVLFLGTGIKPGKYSQRIAVNDIAPTLAEILGLAHPAGAFGRVLQEALQ